MPFRILLICFIAATFSGCALLELGELGEVAAAEDFVAMSESEGLTSSLVEAESLTAEEAAIAGGGEALLIEDETALLTELEEIELRNSASGPPRLYVKGHSEPFAEVVGKRYVKFLKNGNKYYTKNTIFRATSNDIIVRSSRMINSGNKIVTLRSGGFVQKLYESEGWYWIEVVEDGAVFRGWVPVTDFLALVLLGTNDKNQDRKEQEKKVDYKKMIAPYFLNRQNSTEVTVYVVDQNGNFSPTLSSGISKIYSDSGYLSNFSLLSPDFALTPGFEKLYNGDKSWSNGSVNINKYCDYILLGRATVSFENGTIVSNTRVCHLILDMKILSSYSLSPISTFQMKLNGIGFLDEEALGTSEMHVFSQFRRLYSKINI